MRGHKPSKIFAEHASGFPEIRHYYDHYISCRQTQLVVYRKPVGTQGEEKLVTVIWPTGYSLPRPGGVEQQSFLEMRLFAAFLRGEQSAAEATMKK